MQGRLHDRKEIEGIDRSSMYRSLLTFPFQLEKGWELSSKIDLHYRPKSLIICGMGGSAIGGSILRDIMGYESRFPVHIVRGYELNVNPDGALVICMSYSGNTEETLSAAAQALQSGSKCVFISSGGQLEELAKSTGTVHIKLPSGYQPRAALGFMLSSLIGIADGCGLHDFSQNIMEVIQHVRDTVASVSLDGPDDSVSRKIALWLENATPVIAGTYEISSVVERCKTQFNENSKRLAWTLVFPESNHNDWIPLMVDSHTPDYRFLLLEPFSRNSLLLRRMKIVREKLESRAPVFSVHASAANFTAALLEYIVIGDWASYYAALLQSIDPSPVEPIEELKKLLKGH